jgi:hypothetical protein
MNSTFKEAIVLLAGLSLFSFGAWLRFNAAAFGTISLPDGTQAMVRSHEFIETAYALLLCGGCLIVLSCASWLFSSRKS